MRREARVLAPWLPRSALPDLVGVVQSTFPGIPGRMLSTQGAQAGGSYREIL